MFIEYFVMAILGHFVGDYIFQNQWMAVQKSKPGGAWPCTVHVLLYTLSIAFLTNLWNPLFLLSVAIPHWVIDRWGLAWYWLSFKNGGQDQREAIKPWEIAFVAPVYIANDNTFHFLCLWLSLRWFLN